MSLGKELRLDDIKDLVWLDCGLKGKEENGWYSQLYRHQAYGKWDIIYVTCRDIIEKNDRSPQAYKALEICFQLLQPDHGTKRKRWPDELNHANDAKNIISAKLDMLRWKVWYVSNEPNPGHRLYGPQTWLTRDPYIYFFTAAALLGEWHYIQHTSMPARLYRQPTWMWHQYLKGKKNNIPALEKYKKLENRGRESKYDYVKLLKHYRKMAVLIKLGGI